MKTFLLCTTLFIGFVGGILYFEVNIQSFKEPFIKSYEECVAAGFSVPLGNPPKCATTKNKVFFGLQKEVKESKKSDVKTISSHQEIPETEKKNADLLAKALDIPLPQEVLLSVPFTPQAPHGNWNPPFDEAYEEAALLMAQRYLTGQTLSKETASEEIMKMVEWEEKNGFTVDATAEEVAEIARKYFSLRATVYSEETVSIENIKAILSLGHPVIIPAAGRLLKNPYFSGEGPPYHMLVIIGFDGDDFITNDPGTRRGEKYKYPQKLILDVIHDWTGTKEKITEGKKGMIVVEKNLQNKNKREKVIGDTTFSRATKPEAEQPEK